MRLPANVVVRAVHNRLEELKLRRVGLAHDAAGDFDRGLNIGKKVDFFAVLLLPLDCLDEPALFHLLEQCVDLRLRKMLQLVAALQILV